jgi:tRNA 5-methylaminomethyl-2-thiouridine biosynthesis bifunctional protein
LLIHEGDAAAVLGALSDGRAPPVVDSVFLDGFSPSLNPAIWSDPVIAGIAALLRPGARVATWTVAGTVRRRLVRHGFTVARRPGLPPKRSSLIAWLQSPVARSPVAQSPVAQSPVAQSPVAQSPVAQSPVAQSPVARSLCPSPDITDR